MCALMWLKFKQAALHHSVTQARNQASQGFAGDGGSRDQWRQE
ncbi:hypothetical protein [Rhodoferax sp.]|nr:hypothetical protein [Rhodoferax sp.]